MKHCSPKFYLDVFFVFPMEHFLGCSVYKKVRRTDELIKMLARHEIIYIPRRLPLFGRTKNNIHNSKF